jgi:hypothetical protein
MECKGKYIYVTISAPYELNVILTMLYKVLGTLTLQAEIIYSKFIPFGIRVNRPPRRIYILCMDRVIEGAIIAYLSSYYE